jgi:two-component sensor histidine kinase
MLWSVLRSQIETATNKQVHHPEQESKNDIVSLQKPHRSLSDVKTSQTQSFAMGNYTPSLNDRPFVYTGKQATAL